MKSVVKLTLLMVGLLCSEVAQALAHERVSVNSGDRVLVRQPRGRKMNKAIEMSSVASGGYMMYRLLKEGSQDLRHLKRKIFGGGGGGSSDGGRRPQYYAAGGAGGGWPPPAEPPSQAGRTAPGECVDSHSRCSKMRQQCSNSDIAAICPATCGVC